MKISAALIACLVGYSSAHGVVTKITGANGVEMAGLTIADGTPRDCSSNGCGSQADTAIIRDGDIKSGATGPLGKTQGTGNVVAADKIAVFMGGAKAASLKQNNATSGVGKEDDIPAVVPAAGQKNARQDLAGLLGGLGLGGGAAAPAAAGATAAPPPAAAANPVAGMLGGLGVGGAGGQGKKVTGPPESRIAATAGAGTSKGLPTAAEDGTVSVTYLQINQDGAGPLEGMIDGTSGGTQMAAFKSAQVTQNVPGIAVGVSAASTTEFPVKVQMPAGMTCDANVGGASNVCVLRLRNNTPAGPFGGSVAFTQTAAARKRALAYRRKMLKARAPFSFEA